MNKEKLWKGEERKTISLTDWCFYIFQKEPLSYKNNLKIILAWIKIFTFFSTSKPKIFFSQSESKMSFQYLHSIHGCNFVWQKSSFGFILKDEEDCPEWLFMGLWWGSNHRQDLQNLATSLRWRCRRITHWNETAKEKLLLKNDFHSQKKRFLGEIFCFIRSRIYYLRVLISPNQLEKSPNYFGTQVFVWSKTA